MYLKNRKQKAFILGDSVLGLAFVTAGIMLVALNQQYLVRQESQAYSELQESYQALNRSKNELAKKKTRTAKKKAKRIHAF